jgi:helix-turn-helix protein
VDLQENLGVKSEEMARNAANASKKVFAFVVKAECEVTKCAVNAAVFLPKNIIEGVITCLTNEQTYKGKQSIKHLVGSGAKLEDIPINANNIGDFKSTARKHGIDYSLKKVVTQDESGEMSTSFVVFFKAKNANVLKSVLQDYSLKKLEHSRKKSIKAEIEQDRSQNRNRERVRQKNKTREEVL